MTEQLVSGEYALSFKKGQQKAESVKSFQSAVFGEIKRASDQLKIDTGNKLEIHPYKKTAHPLVKLGEMIQKYMDPISEEDLIFVLGASNPSAKTAPVYLGTLHFFPEAISVNLGWLKELRICNETSEFIEALKEMLENPIIGNELHKIVTAVPDESAVSQKLVDSGEE